MKLIIHEFIKEGFRFSIIGVLNTFVGLGTIFLLFNVFKFDYRLANLIGYCLGLINSFLWNKYWNFKSKENTKRQIIPFLTIFLIAYCINLSIVIFSVENSV